MSATAPTETKRPGVEKFGLLRGLARIYAYVPPTRRRQFFLLLGLMLLRAFAELASIGAIVPFLSLLANPEGLGHFPWAVRLFDALGATNESDRLVAAAVMFASFVMMAGAFRLQLAWMTQDFIFSVGHDVSVEIQRRVLSQPYSFHIRRNSSTLVAAMEKSEQLTFNLLLPLMEAVIAGFLSLFIIAALIYIDPLIAGLAATIFLVMYLIISWLTRRRLLANSAALADAWDDRLKVAQESFGGIRDIIIDNSQSTHLRLFARANRKLTSALANNAFVASAPRFIIETLGMAVIALIALLLSGRAGGFAAALPILGALALGAQRLLPLLQQIYSAWSTLAGSSAVLMQVLDLLQLPAGEDHPDTGEPGQLPVRSSISLKNVSFTYPGRRRHTIENVSVEIPAETSVALVGETGSGKSTLADLLMGLLEPDSGTISIDQVPLGRGNRRRWQQSIAHVPQSIFLTDSTIASNIALGLADEAPDRERIVESAKMAHLHAFVTSLPEAYDTFVGERGIRLSGGQRQRLGIARAIYKRAPVLVLDEATSALDDETEAAVFKSIEQLGREGRTIIIIAHRHSTIARCDMVVRLKEGRIVDIGSFADVVGSKDARSKASRRA